jgi:hypothetical protein
LSFVAEHVGEHVEAPVNVSTIVEVVKREQQLFLVV